MKTIKKNAELKRVKDADVDKYIADGWKYTNKKEWKDKYGKQS
jgi:hypothetical protein